MFTVEFEAIELVNLLRAVETQIQNDLEKRKQWKEDGSDYLANYYTERVETLQKTRNTLKKMGL